MPQQSARQSVGSQTLVGEEGAGCCWTDSSSDPTNPRTRVLTLSLVACFPAVDADSSRTPSAAQAGDVISRLVGIYGSKELFISEYRCVGGWVGEWVRRPREGASATACEQQDVNAA